MLLNVAGGMHAAPDIMNISEGTYKRQGGPGRITRGKATIQQEPSSLCEQIFLVFQVIKYS